MSAGSTNNPNPNWPSKTGNPSEAAEVIIRRLARAAQIKNKFPINLKLR